MSNRTFMTTILLSMFVAINLIPFVSIAGKAHRFINIGGSTHYIRVDKGYSRFNHTSAPFFYKAGRAELKPNIHSVIGGGIGTHFADKIRGELIWNHHLSPIFQTKNKITMVRTSIISTYFLNAYYDFKDKDAFINPYVGAGIGAALIKESLQNIVYTKATIRKKWNTAYKYIIGSTFNVTERVKFDISYHGINYGRSASKVVDKLEAGKTNYRGYIINTGLRFEF